MRGIEKGVERGSKAVAKYRIANRTNSISYRPNQRRSTRT